MDINVKNIMMRLIRYEVNQETIPNELQVKFSDDTLVQLYRLSKAHDLDHLIGEAIEENELFTSESRILTQLRKSVLMAGYRYEQLNYVLTEIRKVFEEAKIQFIPLKGSILRQYYPEPWMRTSCDIDVLIHAEDIDKATKVLLNNGFITDNKRNYHDIHFYYGNNHLELHFSICENNKQLDELLSKVWDYVKPISAYEYREIPEFFVFHHIAHMAYHFLSGGCGIRPFIDLWILQQKRFYSEEKLIPLLEMCNLCKFYETVCSLISIWMANGQHNVLTMEMGKYVLDGGVYGSSENFNSIGAATSNGKKKFLLKIAFPPYKTMCIIYPSLKRHKFMLPFYYIHRVIIKLFGNDRKRVKARINNTMSQSKEKIEQINFLLNALEISK